jgi:murein DD-endopeptidase MepM/ murein hydrolase activator NlpD
MMARSPRLARALAQLLIAISLAGGSAFAMDWPLAPPRLAATFGTFAKGRVVTGVALTGDAGLVRSSDEGEIAFALEEGAHPAGLPTPLGSFVVVAHQKDMTAVYSHLARGTISTYLRKARQGDILGKPGSSGWIEGVGLLFQVYDRRAGAWVNPLLVLEPLADDKPPVIRSLALSRGDKTYALGETGSVPQGRYRISTDVADPPDAAWTVGLLAPFAIRLSVDGAETAKGVFDVAKAREGVLELFAQSPVPARELRTREGRYALDERLFTRGRATIEVRVEDAAGNKRSASWTIVVE